MTLPHIVNVYSDADVSKNPIIENINCHIWKNNARVEGDEFSKTTSLDAGAITALGLPLLEGQYIQFGNELFEIETLINHYEHVELGLKKW